MLLRTNPLILSTLLLLSQNIALFKIRARSNFAACFGTPEKICEPSKKSNFAPNYSAGSYFFFLKALDI
jgi:hypothetical protein